MTEPEVTRSELPQAEPLSRLKQERFEKKIKKNMKKAGHTKTYWSEAHDLLNMFISAMSQFNNLNLSILNIVSTLPRIQETANLLGANTVFAEKLIDAFNVLNTYTAELQKYTGEVKEDDQFEFLSICTKIKDATETSLHILTPLARSVEERVDDVKAALEKIKSTTKEEPVNE